MPTAWIAVMALLTTAALPQGTVTSAQVPAAASPTPAVALGKSSEPDKESGQVSLASQELRKRTGRELLTAVREALPRLARPEDDQLEACVEELLFLHEELREDDAMAISYRSRYRTMVESRLEHLSVQLRKRIARNKRLAKREPPAQIRSHEEAKEHLAQRAGGAARPAPPLVGNGPAGPRGRQQPSDDYGQHLVELIQKTIAPSTWDVNGGLGTIYYWRPGRALVVRQTGEIHDQMGGVLGQLRRAGP